MNAYLSLLRQVLEKGEERADRTKTGTLSLFGGQLDINLQDGFPLLTTKKLHIKSIIHELLWFLRGEDDISYLKKHDIKIWNPWARPDGGVGPIYGVQWRRWEQAEDFHPIDQIERVIKEIKKNPCSRRLLVSAWNVSQLQDMALPPCHVLFQFYVDKKKRLSCHMYQRSADIFLGLPFNIASYALLTHMIAYICKLSVGRLLISFGDLHLYKTHISVAKTQLGRIPKELPTLDISGEVECIDDFSIDNFEIYHYNPHSHIKASISV